ncbi:hypothetical protein DAPPUDRAFT_241770 [Daphnia pulex]|uniref:Uncharacterized protein n=1 Tax=Daphnia pulex TaxID=6669 RepID=E9GF25_DAPPU|nr:hypothetical protein DAPPUDRAFT_241770 [Daphnia pulex]|eukprot:EFX81933.1 hypothetical protein DAPPUDRAFT_241770 [Daphnia pulex]
MGGGGGGGGGGCVFAEAETVTHCVAEYNTKTSTDLIITGSPVRRKKKGQKKTSQRQFLFVGLHLICGRNGLRQQQQQQQLELVLAAAGDYTTGEHTQTDGQGGKAKKTSEAYRLFFGRHLTSSAVHDATGNIYKVEYRLTRWIGGQPPLKNTGLVQHFRQFFSAHKMSRQENQRMGNVLMAVSTINDCIYSHSGPAEGWIGAAPFDTFPFWLMTYPKRRRPTTHLPPTIVALFDNSRRVRAFVNTATGTDEEVREPRKSKVQSSFPSTAMMHREEKKHGQDQKGKKEIPAFLETGFERRCERTVVGSWQLSSCGIRTGMATTAKHSDNRTSREKIKVEMEDKNRPGGWGRSRSLDGKAITFHDWQSHYGVIMGGYHRDVVKDVEDCVVCQVQRPERQHLGVDRELCRPLSFRGSRCSGAHNTRKAVGKDEKFHQRQCARVERTGKTVTGFIPDVLESWARQQQKQGSSPISQSPNESVGTTRPSSRAVNFDFCLFLVVPGPLANQGLDVQPMLNSGHSADAMSNSLLAQLLLRQSTTFSNASHVQTSNYRGRSISAGPLRERLKQTLITHLTTLPSAAKTAGRGAADLAVGPPINTEDVKKECPKTAISREMETIISLLTRDDQRQEQLVNEFLDGVRLPVKRETIKKTNKESEVQAKVIFIDQVVSTLWNNIPLKQQPGIYVPTGHYTNLSSSSSANEKYDEKTFESWETTTTASTHSRDKPINFNKASLTN